MWSITRLETVPPPAIFERMDDEGSASDIEDYLLDSVVLEQWAIRKSAAATLVHEHGCWADNGMAFGNEGYDALLYTLAALEVTKTTKAKAKKAAKPKAKPKAKPAARRGRKRKA